MNKAGKNKFKEDFTTLSVFALFGLVTSSRRLWLEEPPTLFSCLTQIHATHSAYSKQRARYGISEQAGDQENGVLLREGSLMDGHLMILSKNFVGTQAFARTF
ncbi:hypothetical protein TorRG33x02_262210 [Trema orientale]|uniref:Uncharacterized protein n=1 Tax=Trema orientale TaxID=63057 RepID=A0A2P5D4Z3_TREOI|nr:hypothetical protein TorRG33x02_262210 [Trema orientale]